MLSPDPAGKWRKKTVPTKGSSLGLRQGCFEVRAGPGLIRMAPGVLGQEVLTTGSDGQGRRVPRGSGDRGCSRMRWHGGMGGKVAAGSFLDFLAPLLPNPEP